VGGRDGGGEVIALTDPRRPIQTDFTFHGDRTIFHNSVWCNHACGMEELHYTTLTAVTSTNANWPNTEKLIMVDARKRHKFVQRRSIFKLCMIHDQCIIRIYTITLPTNVQKYSQISLYNYTINNYMLWPMMRPSSGM
jgi:hypothetical protein